MRLFDTHAHLDDEQFDDHRPDVIQRASEAGVADIVAVGTTAESSAKVIRLAEEFAEIHAAVGIQPNYVAEAAAEDWAKIEALAHHEQVVAIGETGLDRYWDHTPFPQQQDLFRRHVALAQATDLPFIIHMRDCGQDILDLLGEFSGSGALKGIMHSFTGDKDLAEKCLGLGLHISFAGMVSFKKSDELREVAATVPDNRILVETDAPYLSPHPHRGQRPNEPALMVHTARCVAEARGQTLDEFAVLSTENACRLFGVK